MTPGSHTTEHGADARPTTGRCGTPLALTALVTVLQVSLLAGVPIAGSLPGRPPAMIWRSDRARTPARRQPASRGSNNPRYSFAAGRLALSVGVAVVALAAWLHIMYVHGTRGY